MDSVNSPRVSRFIAGLYLAVILFISWMGFFLAYFLPQLHLKLIVLALLTLWR